MKLQIKRNRGALLLALLVLVVAIIVIGIIAYAIYKALSRWNPRPINPDDVAQWTQSVTAELEATPDATLLSDGTMVQQLGSTNDVPYITVEMSTNLVDWTVRTNIPLSEFDRFVEAEPMDQPAAFYRIRTP